MLSNNKGVTLIELLITVVIVSILAMIAAPSFHDMLKNSHLSNMNSQLVSALNYMRGEALKRKADVTMCVRNNNGDACSTLGSFERGWLIYIGDTPTSNTILMDSKLTPTTDLIVTSTFPATQSITYKFTGKAKTSGSLVLKQGTQARYKISIAMNTGRIRSCSINTTTCTP